MTAKKNLMPPKSGHYNVKKLDHNFSQLNDMPIWCHTQTTKIHIIHKNIW